jgi:hypothetical protein
VVIVQVYQHTLSAPRIARVKLGLPRSLAGPGAMAESVVISACSELGLLLINRDIGVE